MGTHVDFEFVPVARTRSRKGSEAHSGSKRIPLKKRGIALWKLAALVVFAASYAVGDEQYDRREFARKTAGLCFKTGVGAVGMVIETAGTDIVWLMFTSGVKTSYPVDELVETTCPSTAPQ
jgi:hypothetical protein